MRHIDGRERGFRYYMKVGTGSEADIWIYEEIGDSWFGGISAKQFVNDLKALGDPQTIRLHLNSPGGSVFDAVAIHNVLRQHKATVNVSIEGLAASSASVIAMAGDHVEMANNAMLMIHDPWTFSVGSSDDLRRDADTLDKVKDSIMQTYLNKCKKKRGENMRDELTRMMSDETWMNADEALEIGLIDSVGEAMQAAACFDLSKFKYRKAPAALANAPMDQRGRLAKMNIKCIKLRAACGTERTPASNNR
jgi:ATP-dependent Clp protease, protease subunit